ncbi:Zinc finger protein [Armadillidium vulgare]|nr:Zinc finger protein [Armadillidium vulgare]
MRTHKLVISFNMENDEEETGTGEYSSSYIKKEEETYPNPSYSEGSCGTPHEDYSQLPPDQKPEPESSESFDLMEDESKGTPPEVIHPNICEIKEASGGKVFKCSECNYESKWKGNVRVHYYTHSKTKLFKCSECSYETNQKGNLKIHSLNHTDTKLHECTECPYKTNIKNNLSRHVLTHATAKSLKCSGV